MDNNILAVIIQTAGTVFSDHLKTRHLSNQPTPEDSIARFMRESEERFKPFTESIEQPSIESRAKIAPVQQSVSINVSEPEIEEPEVPEGQATKIATGCVPCSLGHFSTCQGLLNESVRFSENGIADREVTDRVMMCLGELNAMERVDLRPEMVIQLEGEERKLAEQALKVSRETRHKLEGMTSAADLHNAAAYVQANQRDIGGRWFDLKLKTLSPEDKAEVEAALEKKMNEIEEETDD